MTKTPTHDTIGMKNFARHCWRSGPSKTLDEILNKLTPAGKLQYDPQLVGTLRDRLTDAIGTFNRGLDGQNVARLLDPVTFRCCTKDDSRKIASKVIDMGPGWEEAAALASLVELCGLGQTAIAGAWAERITRDHFLSPKFDGYAPSTGLPAPADEIALVIGGYSPVDRSKMRPEDWMDILPALNCTTASTLLLYYVVRLRRIQPCNNYLHSECFASLQLVLDRVNHRHPLVMAMIDSSTKHWRAAVDA